MPGPTPPPAAKIRWAPRLQPRLLERLYESDARGFRDDELCDQVGVRLYNRCHTFVLVSNHEVECPVCGAPFAVSASGGSFCPAEGCTWSTTQSDYGESIRKHYAYPGRAMEAFATFHRRYATARSYAEKIVLIDQLIHSFHLVENSETKVKSVASKLLEGNKNEVVSFLDRLSARDPQAKARWRGDASDTIHRHLVSSEPDGE